MRTLVDPDVYRLELQRLFGRTWSVVGHVTEVPDTGDFVTRYIGEDPVIVVRDRSGDIQVLLNVCQHRGMPVCRSEAGTATQFRCIYHGWVYDEQGKFLGSPVAKQEMHGDILSKSELGLRQAQVGTHAGLIFATLDKQAPPLDEHLGEMGWYLDLFFGISESGLEVVGPPQRFTIRGNWKLAAEQFVGGDGYHALSLHRSQFDLGLLGTTEAITATTAPGMEGLDVSFVHGHAVRCSYLVTMDTSIPALDRLAILPPAGMTPEMVPALGQHLDADRIRVLAEARPVVGGIFPNTALFRFPFLSSDGELAGVVGFHTFVPKGPDAVEFWHWSLVERDAPPEFKEKIRRTTVQTVGTSGQIEQDDGECWPAMTRGARGVYAAEQTLKYQALQGESKPADWPGGGIVSEGFTKDDGQWYWWQRYFDYLTGKV
ncbi:aromatic ring-hydroxylating dioxygenase subunit alpha [Nocardia aurea]|uniref:aromatic ring-hydroxylating dioxygenase subunit alpha n=1 Tax=Nocardia aurea TaxID=2144174 RepID=UPI000D688339|nr:aromatic ring-hydroxylating dioxygenase subunit alpha [Nocardia aurea]